MADLFELLDEVESPEACTWTVQRIDSEGGIHRHSLKLSWADYDLFVPGGSTPPMVVAEAVMTFMLQHDALHPLGPSLDASTPRRRVPDADKIIESLIRS